MGSLARGLFLGLAFGLAAAALDLGFAGYGTVLRRFGPGPSWLLQTALLEIGLGALLGLALAPLLRLGRLALLAALALVWLGLGWLVELESPMGRMAMLVPAIGGGVLVALGLLLARWRAWLPWSLVAALLATAVFAPQAYIDATTPPAPARAALPPAPESAPDVVLVVLDTVRAANLSTYGHGRRTAPTLDALAEQGTLFADATSPATWSLPSHASLFTGRYPTGHGAHGEHLTLDGRFPTLAQVLASRGWETLCFTANAWISDGLGLTRGFRYQDGSWRRIAGAGRNFAFVHRLLDRVGLEGGDKGGAVVAANFGAWLAERPADAPPYFAFLNFIEAHFPYHQLPREYAQHFTDRPMGELEKISMALMAQQFGGPGRDPAEAGPPARDMYDGGVLYTDELLRRVVEAIRTYGSLDRTILVVLADHGEILGEYGGYFGHGETLYQESVSVPLLVRYPPAIPAGARVEAPVSTVGVFATILDLAGVEVPPTLHVGSLAPLARGEADGSDPGPVLAEITKATALGGPGRSRPDPQMRAETRYRAYRDGTWKLVETSEGEVFLYDLASEAGEARDLAGGRPEELARLRAALEATRERLGLPPLDAELASGEAAPVLDEATVERLRELGYVE
jgi:arylsulfatase A-like enzyme